MNYGILSLLIVFLIIGIIISSFLIYKRATKKQLICPINDSCNKVLESRYSHIFYIKNDAIGLLFYLFFLFLLLYFLFYSNNSSIILTIIKIISGIAVLFSAFLTYIQSKIIKAYCFYCLSSALINLFIFLVVLIA